MSFPQVFNDASNAASEAISNAADVASDAIDAGAAPSAGDAASAVFTDSVVDGAISAGSGAFDLVTDDRVWGEDIAVDQGEGPRRFGYGEDKTTLGELSASLGWSGEDTDAWNVTTNATHELAAQVRAFGHADGDTLSASFGLETEDGYHGTTERTYANGTDAGREDIFFGLRARGHGEVGALGGSAGEEAFLGFSYNRRQDSSAVGTGERWRSAEYSVDLGVAESFEADLDVLGAEVYAGVRAGLDVRSTTRDHEPIAGGIGLLHKGDLKAFAGVVLQGGADVSATGFEGNLDAFAGARATYRRGLSLAYDGTEIAGGYIEGEGRVGVGVTAEAKFGLDWEEKEIGWHGKGGAAVGVGFALGFGGTVGGKDLGTAFDVDPAEQD